MEGEETGEKKDGRAETTAKRERERVGACKNHHGSY